jgi:hypothetical protein
MRYNKDLEKQMPDGWKFGLIEDIAQVVGGGTPSTKVESYFTANGIHWLTPKDLSGYEGKFIERGATDITEKGLKNSSAKLMPKGSILFTSRAPIGYVAISLNNNLGYGVVYGPDISEGGLAPERKYGEVVLVGRLREALRRINRGVPDAAIEEAIKRVLRSESQDLVENNRNFHNLIATRGIPVQQAGRWHG